MSVRKRAPPIVNMNTAGATLVIPVATAVSAATAGSAISGKPDSNDRKTVNMGEE